MTGDSLCSNHTLLKLNLSDHGVGGNEAIKIRQALYDNDAPTDLGLSHNEIKVIAECF